MNFTLETLDDKDFYFTARKDDCDIIPIKMYLSTSSLSTKVLCDANRNRMKCKTLSHEDIDSAPRLKDYQLDLYGGYDAVGIHFTKEGSKYLLKISSAFTPADKNTLCAFLMEWPSSVNLKETQGQVPEYPKNFDVCEDFCDSLKNETGILNRFQKV
uniref:Uncharacterized protein n=1 Tax=Panagrolaimus sp. PS1159 TaxID=55785 RepID=A0AC35GQV1_9BILA